MALSPAQPASATPPATQAGPESRPVSTRRQNANRRNAAKSTGPRTAEGKKASRENAMKHGLCARRIVIPGEDESEFRAYEAGIIQATAPANDDELDLARRIAKSGWHLDRADSAYTSFDTLRIQASKKDHRFPNPDDHRFNFDFLVTGILHTDDADTRKFERYHVHAHRAYHRNREALRKLQNDRFRRERSDDNASRSAAAIAVGSTDQLASATPGGAIDAATVQATLQQLATMLGRPELSAAITALNTAEPTHPADSEVPAESTHTCAATVVPEMFASPEPVALVELSNRPETLSEPAPALSESGIGFVAQNPDAPSVPTLVPVPQRPTSSFVAATDIPDTPCEPGVEPGIGVLPSLLA